MIYKVSKTKSDVIRFLNFVENSLEIDVIKKGNLKLVLEELLTNSINHSSNNLKPLEIGIDVHNDCINIEYHEYSEFFNIYDYYNGSDIMEDKINRMEEGGLGIYLIFNLIKNYQFFYDQKHLKNIMKITIFGVGLNDKYNENIVKYNKKAVQDINNPITLFSPMCMIYDPDVFQKDYIGFPIKNQHIQKKRL